MMATSVTSVAAVTAGFSGPAESGDAAGAPLAEGIPLSEPSHEIGTPGSDLWLYRDRTIGILRRYMRLSIEVGRLPSLLGREFFRTRVTSYRVATFEDAVIFVHDVERVLKKLDVFDKELIGRVVVLQDYSQDEAAQLMKCGRRTVVRRFPEALDNITESFLDGGLLTRLPTSSTTSESCQEAESTQEDVSDCASSE